ncbi:hypothetical protein ACI49Z_000313 [Cronobacter turicensis]|uniref:hypothetical protein n=1 Tax=Cronobacter turicensis TaxID=413502 RepID=UPI001DA9EDC7|nr:hypothetical protein [Cronobacter turicensis]EGT5682639.1 hypothetical protein [Cronobacter turicensis]EGT5741509.1 hypothetical protein [Cronobacter turicensis]EKM5066423.1 hypothetical protein [Cronobacter turicensis]ELY3835623.1 hypothetical protein [Cronobacter turicensis]ELY6319761.1 hypothetical protein [Cronobacter turicensis]
MENALNDILKSAIYRQEPFMDQPFDFSAGDDTELYSPTGQLDSLSLLTIISDVEQQLFKVLGYKIKLATEQDLSFQNSPFKTYGKMLSFINEKIQLSLKSIAN